MIEQAVVLATGSREACVLERVAGLPLAKRTVLAIARAGVQRIVIVAHANHERLAKLIAGDRDITALGREIVVVYGVDAAAAKLDGPALVVGGDLVFDPEIIKRLRNADFAASSCLAVSHDDELLVCAAAASDQVDLANARVLDVGELLLRRVATAEQRAAAEAAMFRGLRKRVDGPIARAINRRVSIAITKRLVSYDITPNQMTVVATLFGVAGVWFVFQATWSTLVVGAFLVQMQSILDGCDGEIARLKFKSSRVGEWLDNVLDDQVNVAYGLALGYAASQLLDNLLWLWLGIGSAAAFLIHNAIFYAQLAFVHRSGNPFNFRWWFEKGSQDVTAMLQDRSAVAALGGIVRALVRRDVFLFAFFVLAAVHLPQVAVTWYALVAASQFGLIVMHVLLGGPWMRR